jgi:hypothetical protein
MPEGMPLDELALKISAAAARSPGRRRFRPQRGRETIVEPASSNWPSR